MFWVVISCSIVSWCECFGTTWCLHRQDWKLSSFFMMYLTTLSVNRTKHITLNVRKTGRNVKGRGRCLIYGTNEEFAWIEWGRAQKSLIRIVDVPGLIRTGHLSNGRQKRYRLRSPALLLLLLLLSSSSLLLALPSPFLTSLQAVLANNSPYFRKRNTVRNVRDFFNKPQYLFSVITQ